MKRLLTSAAILFAATIPAYAAIDLIGYDGRSSSNATLKQIFFDVKETSSTWGGIINVNYGVYNQGSTAAGAFRLKFYLSRDSTIDPATDSLFYTDDIASLAAGSISYVGGFSQPMLLPNTNPLSGTTFYIGMVVDADSQVTESNESNNRNAGNFIDKDTTAITIVNPVANIQVTDEVAPETDRSINFAEVPNDGAGGSFVIKRVSIYNNGTKELNVTNIALTTGTHFKIDRILSSIQNLGQPVDFPRVISPDSDETWAIHIKCDPTVTSAVSDTLTISSDDPDSPTVTISLSANGSPSPAIQITDSTVPATDRSENFGEVNHDGIGKLLSTRTLTVTNPGTGPLTVAQNGLTFLTGTHFKVTTVTSSTQGAINLATGSRTIAPASAEKWTVTLVFDPLADGEASDALNIATNDPDEPIASVTLIGRGRPLGILARIGTPTFQPTHADGVGKEMSTYNLDFRNDGEVALTFPANPFRFVPATHFRVTQVRSSTRGIISVAKANQSMAPNKTEIWTVTLAFDPTSAALTAPGGIVTADFTYLFNSPLGSPTSVSATVALTGTALNVPDILVLDSAGSTTDLTLPFGRTEYAPTGLSLTKTVTIKNLGAQPLVFDLNGISATNFTVKSITSAAKKTINLTSTNAAYRTLLPAQADTWTITLVFTPPMRPGVTPSPGPVPVYPGTLTLRSNDPDETTVSVALSAEVTDSVIDLLPYQPSVASSARFLVAGEPLILDWVASTPRASPVIDLYRDTDTNFQTGLTAISTSLPYAETGKYSWTPPTTLVGQTFYVAARVRSTAVPVIALDYTELPFTVISSSSKPVIRSQLTTASGDYAWEVEVAGTKFYGSVTLTQMGLNVVSVPVTINGVTALWDFTVNRVASLLETKGYTYDEMQRPKTFTNGNGILTTFTYDLAGRLIKTSASNGAVIEYTYDAAGRTTSMKDSTGYTFYTWDSLDRMTACIMSSNSKKGDKDDLKLAYLWDTAGRRTGIIYPGGERMSYTYDAAGRMLTAVNLTKKLTFTYEYKPTTGQLIALNRPNGIRTTFEYDGSARPTRILNQKSGVLVADYAYTLDAAGNALTFTTTLPGGVVMKEQYGYDKAGRLIQVIYSDDDGLIEASDKKLDYTYDGNGNRLTQTATVSGLITERRTYTYGNENRLLRVVDQTGTEIARYTYDAAGNRTQTITPTETTNYSYDERNLLIRISTATSTRLIRYNGAGQRVGEIVDGVETKLVNDVLVGAYELVQRRSTTGAVLASRSLGAGGELVSYAGAVASMPLQDRLGSFRAWTTTTGTVTGTETYNVFGKADTATTTRGFNGQEHVEKLLFLRARFYDPASGVFLGKDPLGASASPNGYQYVASDPINKDDATGLYPVTVSSPDPDPKTGNMFNNYSQSAGLPISARNIGDVSNPLSNIVRQNGSPDSLIIVGHGQISGGGLGMGTAGNVYQTLGSNLIVPEIGSVSQQLAGIGSQMSPEGIVFMMGCGVAQSPQVMQNAANSFNRTVVGSASDVHYYTYQDGSSAGAWTPGPVYVFTPANNPYAPNASQITGPIPMLSNVDGNRHAGSGRNVGGVLIDKAAQFIGTNLSDIRGATFDPNTGQICFLGTESAGATKDVNMDYFFTAIQAVYGSFTPPFVSLDPPAQELTPWQDYGDGDGLLEPGEYGGFFLLWHPIWPEEVHGLDVVVTGTYSGTGFKATIKLNCTQSIGTINGIRATKPEFVSVTGLPAGLTFDNSPYRPNVISDGYFEVNEDGVFAGSTFRIYNSGAGIANINGYSVVPAKQHRRYGGRLEGTRLGWVMYEADRVMKCLCVGKDNLTNALYNSSTVPVTGYKNILERMRSGGKAGNIRMWFVPNEMNLKRHVDPVTGLATVVFDKSTVSLLTESMLSGVPATPIASDFASHFTANYDAFAARTFPVNDPNDPTGATIINVKIFEMLKEAMQSVSLARFFRDNNVPLDMWWMNQWQPPVAYTPKVIATAYNEDVVSGQTFVIYGGVEVQKPNAYVPSSAAKSVADSILAGRPVDSSKPTEDLKSTTWTASTSVGTLRAVAASLQAEQQDGNVDFPEVFHTFASPGMPLTIAAYYSSSWLGKDHLGPGWRCQRYQLEFSHPSIYDEGKYTTLPKDKNGDTGLRRGEVRLVDLATGATLDFVSSLQWNYGVTNFGNPLNNFSGLNSDGVPTFTPGLRQNGTRLSQDADKFYTVVTPTNETLLFGPDGKLWVVTDKNGHTQTYGYRTDNGKLAAITDELDQRVFYNYDANGRLDSIDGPEGVGVRFVFDSSQRLSQVIHLTSNAVLRTYTYNAQNQLQTATDMYGVKRLGSTPDERGRMDQSQDSRGNTTDMKFFRDALTKTKTVKSKDPASTLGEASAKSDTVGRMLASTNIYGSTTGFDYANGALAPTAIRLPTAGRPAITIARNAANLPTQIHDPAVTGASPVAITYNGANKPTKIVDQLKRSTLMTYTPTNDVSKVTRYLGTTAVSTSMAYTDGFVSSVTNPLGHKTTINRDNLGRTTSVVDATGVTISYEYDSRGRLIKITDPKLSSPITYVYDDLDRVTSVTTPSGTTTYQYDPVKKWLTKVTDPLNRSVAYTYNNTTGDVAKTSVELSPGVTLDTAIAYNRVGGIQSITPPGSLPIGFNFDDGGLLMGTYETGSAAPGTPQNVASNNAKSGVPTTNRNHIFTWGAPYSDLPITAYSYAFDAVPDNTPEATGATATYNNVTVANHTFQVKARDSAGRWGSVAVFNLNVVASVPAPAPMAALRAPATLSVASWKQSAFSSTQLANAGISDDLADPDKDGLQNLLEYGLGTPPMVPSTGPATAIEPGVPVMKVVNGKPTLTYRRDRRKTDIQYVTQWSADLKTWHTEDISETTTPIDGSNEDEVTSTCNQPNGRFLRLQVVRP